MTYISTGIYYLWPKPDDELLCHTCNTCVVFLGNILFKIFSINV